MKTLYRYQGKFIPVSVLAAVMLLAPLLWANPAIAVSGVVEKASANDFDQTIQKVKQGITANKLVLIKDLDHQQMLKMVGVNAPRSMGFEIFHPRYGKQLHANDFSAFIAVPIRILVQEHGGKVMVSYQQPSALLAPYKGLDDLVSATDGSSVRVTVPGEAMDTGDKSTNKAMSMAMKYASLLTFCIPTEGEDADATAHDLKGERNMGPQAGPIGVNNGAGIARSSKSSTPPPKSKRALTKVVQINGKRVRTAGIEADQLIAIWDAVGRSGKDKVAQALKLFGVEKSVQLFKDEAQQVLARLNGSATLPPHPVNEAVSSH